MHTYIQTSMQRGKLKMLSFFLISLLAKKKIPVKISVGKPLTLSTKSFILDV